MKYQQNFFVDINKLILKFIEEGKKQDKMKKKTKSPEEPTQYRRRIKSEDCHHPMSRPTIKLRQSPQCGMYKNESMNKPESRNRYT